MINRRKLPCTCRALEGVFLIGKQNMDEGHVAGFAISSWVPAGRNSSSFIPNRCSEMDRPEDTNALHIYERRGLAACLYLQCFNLEKCFCG